MNSDEQYRQQQYQRLERDRLQREKGLRDQQKRLHEEAMKQQRDHFDRLRHDQQENARRDPRPRGGASWTVWYFGGIGALFGGLNPPLQWDWFMGGTLGFLVGGFLGGYLRQFAWGRAVLWIVGLGFAALIALAIYRS